MVDLSKIEILAAIDEFLSKLEKPSPKGCCLEVSTQFSEWLWDRYKYANVSVQFGWLDGQQHSWVEVWGKDWSCLVVDFTADQFGEKYPKVIIGEMDVKSQFEGVCGEFYYKYDSGLE